MKPTPKTARVYVGKVLLTVVLLAIAYWCFSLAPETQTETYRVTKKTSADVREVTSTTTTNGGAGKPFEWTAMAIAILTLWVLWRKELGIGQLAFLGERQPNVSPQPPGSPVEPEEAGPPPPLDLTILQQKMAADLTQQQLEHIMKAFGKVHAVSVSYVSRHLRVSRHTAQRLLQLLTQTGQLRADGFPQRTIYTLARSVEKKTLDGTRDALSAKFPGLSEQRFVRIGPGYEADAVLESPDTVFVVEAKFLPKPGILDRLDDWIMQLLTVAKQSPSDKVAGVLSIGCAKGVDAEEEKRLLRSHTFDSGRIPVHVLVFSGDDLEKHGAIMR